MTLLRINNRILKKNGIVLARPIAPPAPYTIRLKFTNGVTPTFSKGTGVQVSSSPNIWDLTYENGNWYNLLRRQSSLIEVIAANTTGISNMNQMFGNCNNLTSVPLFDTSNVTNMDGMFNNCSALTTVPLFDTSSATSTVEMFSYCISLTSIPLFNTSRVTDATSMFRHCRGITTIPLLNTSSVTRMGFMFHDCINVQSGALALYQQASTQATPPSKHAGAFENCGSNTTTGAAELALIPTDWGGNDGEFG